MSAAHSAAAEFAALRRTPTSRAAHDRASDRHRPGRERIRLGLDGGEDLDFVGGIGVLNVGHDHPRVVAAVEEQLEA